jgi:hypothetical protein
MLWFVESSAPASDCIDAAGTFLRYQMPALQPLLSYLPMVDGKCLATLTNAQAFCTHSNSGPSPAFSSELDARKHDFVDSGLVYLFVLLAARLNTPRD